MFNKIYEFLKKDIKKYWKTYVVFIIVFLLMFIELDYNVHMPGGLINLDDRIEIDGGYESKGSFNLTYVSAKKGIIPVILLSYIIPSWDLVSLDNSRVEDESQDEIILRNQIYLKETSYDAVISAFNAAGKKYEIENIDVTVSYIYDYANTNLELGDVIKSINGVVIEDYITLKEEVIKYKENDKLDIKVLRNDKIIDAYAVLKNVDDNVVIGVTLAQIKDIKTDPEVEFVFKDNESGASRGLMCALEIYNRITKDDLTKGDIISGTGSIDENGIVGSIDGVEYKLKGAVKNNAKVFIVPTDNYNEAIKIKEEENFDIEIIKADTLENVIKALIHRK